MKVLGLTVVTCAVLLLLKAQGRTEYAFAVTLVFSAVVFIWLIAQLEPLLTQIREAGEQAGLESATLGLVFKITGVALVSELAAQLCRDAGEGALAQKAELAGKLCVTAMGVPMLLGLCTALLELLP